MSSRASLGRDVVDGRIVLTAETRDVCARVELSPQTPRLAVEAAFEDLVEDVEGVWSDDCSQRILAAESDAVEVAAYVPVNAPARDVADTLRELKSSARYEASITADTERGP